MRALSYLLGGPGDPPPAPHQHAVSLILSLSRSVYCAGDTVHGFVEVASPADTPSGLLSLDITLHGHVRVEPRWLHLSTPVRAACGQQAGGAATTTAVALPPFADVQGENCACIFATPASPAVVRLAVPVAGGSSPTTTSSSAAASPTTTSSSSWRRAFAVRLPPHLLPSFRGFGAKIFYVASVSARFVGTSSSARARGGCELHLPFSVMGGGQRGRGLAAQGVAESVVNFAPMDAPPPPPSPGPSVGVSGWNLHNRVVWDWEHDDEGGGVGSGGLSVSAGPTVFSIRNGPHHIGCLVLHKQQYHPGDVVLGTFDLTGGAVRCYQVAVALVTREAYQDVDAGGGGGGGGRSLGTYEAVLDTHHEYTLNCVQTSFMLRVPIDAQVGFDCGVVSLAWLLRFEFTIANSPLTGDEAGVGPGTATAGETSLLQWTTGLAVVPPTTAAETVGGDSDDDEPEPPPSFPFARAEAGVGHSKRVTLELS